MEFDIFQGKEEAAMRRVLVSMVAEILLICAVVMGLFIYLRVPAETGTPVVIVLFFIGSIFCWKSFSNSQIILLLSLAVMELVTLDYFSYLGWLIMAFFFLDALVIYLFTKLS